MNDNQEEASGFARDCPASSHSVKLPEFWPDNLAAWFALAESRFIMRDIYDEWSRYDHVLSSLSKDSIHHVQDGG